MAVGDAEMYLGAKCGLFMKIALHKVTVLSGCDFTPAEKNNNNTFSIIVWTENDDHVLYIRETY